MKQASPNRTHTLWSHLYEVPRIVTFIETENRRLAVKGLEAGGKRKVESNGDRVPLGEEEKVLETGGL